MLLASTCYWEKGRRMSVSDEVKEWWTQTLLNQQKSVHPIFGDDIDVELQGDVATLTGEVETVERSEEIERELRSIRKLGTVVNRLKVTGIDETYHLQTVVAVFSDRDGACLASEAVTSWKLHGERAPEMLETEEAARAYLRERARAAQVPEDTIQQYIDAIGKGKVLLADRVPEDDALRIISALEGTRAESIQTLPPEPHSVEGAASG